VQAKCAFGVAAAVGALAAAGQAKLGKMITKEKGYAGGGA